jgi:hypothetical protein
MCGIIGILLADENEFVSVPVITTVYVVLFVWFVVAVPPEQFSINVTGFPFLNVYQVNQMLFRRPHGPSTPVVKMLLALSQLNVVAFTCVRTMVL